MTMIVMQQQHKNSKEGKDLFRKSIIRYQIYPAIYSQLDCFEVPKLGSKPQKKLTAPLKAKSLASIRFYIHSTSLGLICFLQNFDWHLHDCQIMRFFLSQQAVKLLLTTYLLDTTIILLRVPDGSANQAYSSCF